MELKIAHLINLILISVFVGTEFAIGVFVHPVLRKLSPSVHIASVQVIGRIVGKVMPVWIPLIIVSALPVLYVEGPQVVAFWFTIAGIICIVLMLIVSLLGNVPINKQVIEWNPQSPPANWLELRKRWDSLHRSRIILDIAALLFFLIGAIF